MTTLDADELMHLGLHALQNNETENALVYLKESLEQEPDNPGALYLLAAGYAQIGLYERAKPLFQRTLELAPREYTAAFQLGLLHLTGGDIESCRETWARLEELGSAHALHKFKSGLLALVGDDFSACVALLDEGMEANDFNPALNADMLKIREAVSKGPGSPSAPQPLPSSEFSHFMLNSYQQSQEKP